MTIEIRSMEVTSIDEEKRTVTGIAVPYEQTVSVGAYKERFERGAFGEIKDVKIFYGHNEPIGKVTRGEDTDGGFAIEAVISKTSRGDEVYTLIRDGVINKFSVGFVPVEDREEKDNVVVRTKVEIKEVSVVPFPAYDNAHILSVREAETTDSQVRESESTNKKETNMSNEVNQEVADLRSTVDDLERRMTVLSTADNSAPARKTRSAGEILKGLASNDQEAREEFLVRDFGTSVEADIVRPGWVNERMRLSLANRQVIGAFGTSPIPATGNSVEYPFVKTEQGTVARQVAEGDALSYMEVALDTATTPVNTYGGYSALSRQSIERSDLAYLETVLEYQVRQYAKATESAVRTVITTVSAPNTATIAADTAAAWIEIVIDAAAAIEDNSKGSQAEFAIVSRDVFKRLSKMIDNTNRPLFAISGQPVNALGSTNLVTPAINIGGLSVQVAPLLPNQSFYVASSDALKVWESSGAPFRLQDENVVNITKDFSLYGYMAAAVIHPKAITKCDVDLV